MAFNIANFFEAPRYSARAGETFTHGMVAKVLDWGNGERKLMKVANTDGQYLSGGGDLVIITKYDTDVNQVQSSTAPSSLGSRLVTISSGDHVVGSGHGTIAEYSADLLHASLDPAGATPPKVGDQVQVKDSMFCAVGVAGGLGQTVGNVFRVFGSKVLINLTYSV